MDEIVKNKCKAFEKHVGQVMLRWRKIRGYTQDNVGDAISISGRTVGKYEKGKIPIRASIMAAMSYACKFDMIEYILMDGMSLAQKVKELIHIGGIDPYAPHAEAVPTQDIEQDRFKDMKVLEQGDDGKVLIMAQLANNYRTKKQQKTDILYDFPRIHPFPLCDKDIEDFERYMSSPEKKDKRNLILYGYELASLFQKDGTPARTTSALARQILKRVITEHNEIDQVIYNFYWKCLYNRQG